MYWLDFRSGAYNGVNPARLYGHGMNKQGLNPYSWKSADQAWSNPFRRKVASS
jgi:hypothetical protein